MSRVALIAVLVALSGLSGGTAAGAPSGCDGWMMSIRNFGFEETPDGTAVPGWCAEGAGTVGVDQAAGWSRTGDNNAYLQTDTPQWTAMTQYLPLPGDPNYRFELHGWLRTSSNVTHGRFGVRSGATTVLSEVKFGTVVAGYREFVVSFRGGGLPGLTVFAGYWSPVGFSWVLVDDLRLVPFYEPTAG